MAFASMFLAFIAIIAVGLFLFFMLGLLLFIVGIANKKKVKRDKKKWPIVLMVLGIINMVPPVLITVILIIVVSVTNYRTDHMMERYDNLPTAWAQADVYAELAERQALQVVSEALDEGDRDALAENFSEDSRGAAGFDEALDDLFEAFPEELNDIEWTRFARGGDVIRNGCRGTVQGYTAKVGGEYYYLTIGMVYEGDDHPDEVGLFYLTVLNTGSDAYRIFGDTPIEDTEADYTVLCWLPDTDEVNARRVNGMSYLWEETSAPVMTADQMRAYLAGYDTLRDAIDGGGIGMPNCNPVYDGFASNQYIYELSPVNGEPRYAFIRTSGEYGRITEAYECTPDDGDYDNMIVEFQAEGT